MERLMQAFRTEEAFGNIFEQVRVRVLFSARILSKLVASIRKKPEPESFVRMLCFSSLNVLPHVVAVCTQSSCGRFESLWLAGRERAADLSRNILSIWSDVQATEATKQGERLHVTARYEVIPCAALEHSKDLQFARFPYTSQLWIFRCAD